MCLVGRTLQNLSQQLESLEALLGLQSFFLVVNPRRSDDKGFLGGTIAGREFWRGHRGCGQAGADIFKAQCRRSRQNPYTPYPPTVLPPLTQSAPLATSPPRKKGPARELKAELYGAIRDALRSVEMLRIHLSAEIVPPSSELRQACGMQR